MPARHRLIEVTGTKQDQVVGVGGLCGTQGTCHDHMAAQPSPRPPVSPVMQSFAPPVSTPGEISFLCAALLCLQLGP